MGSTAALAARRRRWLNGTTPVQHRITLFPSRRPCQAVLDGTGASIGTGEDRAIWRALPAPCAASRDASFEGCPRGLVGWLQP
jgi:hypothetical protein